MGVRVVVDSSAGLPQEVVEELDICVVDLHRVEGAEGESSSGLSSLELAACYARQLERGGDDGVIALHPVSYTHLTLPTTLHECRSRWSPYH